MRKPIVLGHSNFRQSTHPLSSFEDMFHQEMSGSTGPPNLIQWHQEAEGALRTPGKPYGNRWNPPRNLDFVLGHVAGPRGQVPVNGSPWITMGMVSRVSTPKGMTVARINCIGVGARSVGLTSDSWAHLKNGLSNSHIHSHSSNIHV